MNTSDSSQSSINQLLAQSSNGELHTPIIISNPFTLTEDERILFTALEAAAEHHYQRKSTQSAEVEKGSSTLSTQRRALNIRVAGGWVRDKLLNRTSDDIDVTLDEASGVQFAHMVRDYLEQYDDDDVDHPHKYKIGVISANPSQSKHLETATMKLFGFHVDFSHLRAEESYHADSRIPVIRDTFGTPYEDAMRRDFTINSLFYNIRTQSVEDYTRRGIHDLITQPTIVTPIHPMETFHDDPLRVLRAIRFSVRFQYPLDDELRRAAASREVQESLMRKVSRERVGTELEAMFTGKAANPQMALALINELGLSDAVFVIIGNEANAHTICGSIVFYSHGGKEDCSSQDNSQDGISDGNTITVTGPSLQPPIAYQNQTTPKEREMLRKKGWSESLQRLKLVETILTPYKDWVKKYPNIRTQLDERIFLLALYLSPFRDLSWQDTVNVKQKMKRHRVVTMSMMKDGIKFPNRDVDAVECIMEHLDSFIKELKVTSISAPCEKGSFSRLEIGMILRKVKKRWVTCLLLAGCVELRSYHAQQQKQLIDSDDTPSSGSVVQTCENFFRFVQEENLDCCWELQPLVNGKDIMQSLNLKGGPIVGQLTEEQWMWMLQNPQGSKRECEAFLKQKYSSMIA